MTKNEQNRVLAWRLKLLHEASVMPRIFPCRVIHTADRPRFPLLELPNKDEVRVLTA
jgi:hypothetical protein